MEDAGLPMASTLCPVVLLERLQVSDVFYFEGREITINNSFKGNKWDEITQSSNWMTVLPNSVSSNDSGIGTEDGSESSKLEESTLKRPQRWKGPDEQGDYEVQKIVNHRFDKDGRDEFCVKWVGWGNPTWEKLSDLINCQEALNNYLKKMINEILFVQWRKVPSCKKLMVVPYRLAIDHWVKSTPKGMYLKKLSGGLNQKGLSITTLARQLEEAVNNRCSKQRERIVAEIKDHCAVLRLKEVRKEQLELLRRWEDGLNSLGPGGLSVENLVDLEGPPKDFMFIKQNRTGPGLNSCMLIGQVAGCECLEECGTRETCCPNMAGVDWAYSANSGLIVSPRSGIFECNRFCVCGSDCPNRVVQRGRKVKLCIFRTANGRGWGLKAGERIEKGAFLTTYLGEIISSEEAAARDQNYEKTGLSYLFDLDMMDPDEGPMFTIDAMKCGNESHFINHSCNPNAHVAGVWIETNDPAIPLLALFARRSIKKGEEITFNYQGDQDQRAGIANLPNAPKARAAKRCKCGSRFCKGFYF